MPIQRDGGLAPEVQNMVSTTAAAGWTGVSRSSGGLLVRVIRSWIVLGWFWGRLGAFLGGHGPF